MRCIVAYYDNCKKVLSESQKLEKKISMALIEETFGSTILKELRSMKFILPSESEQEISR